MDTMRLALQSKVAQILLLLYVDSDGRIVGYVTQVLFMNWFDRSYTLTGTMQSHCIVCKMTSSGFWRQCFLSYLADFFTLLTTLRLIEWRHCWSERCALDQGYQKVIWLANQNRRYTRLIFTQTQPNSPWLAVGFDRVECFITLTMWKFVESPRWIFVFIFYRIRC